MRLEDFNDIDFNNIGSLPWPVKSVLLLILFLVLIVLGYWFMLKPAFEDLDKLRVKEVELKKTFISKKSQSVKLEAYRAQMADVEKTFGTLLKQLPDKSEMDGLLTDVNQAGLGRGLEFDLFKPGKEIVKEFYAELPIEIKVIGEYHDLGSFASDVSKLPRIVTLNNLAIQSQDGNRVGGTLVMNAIAKTYRYLDSSEIEAKKPNKKKAKKK